MDEEREGQVVKPPAFSNGTDHEMWAAAYCDRCWHDRAARNGDWEKGCELIALGYAHEVVPQWVYKLKTLTRRSDGMPVELMDVHCTKFTPDDEGPDEGPPTPQPTPPGQEQMFDAGEFDWDKPVVPAVDNAPARP